MLDHTLNKISRLWCPWANLELSLIYPQAAPKPEHSDYIHRRENSFKITNLYLKRFEFFDGVTT